MACKYVYVHSQTRARDPVYCGARPLMMYTVSKLCPRFATVQCTVLCTVRLVFLRTHTHAHRVYTHTCTFSFIDARAARIATYIALSLSAMCVCACSRRTYSHTHIGVLEHQTRTSYFQYIYVIYTYNMRIQSTLHISYLSSLFLSCCSSTARCYGFPRSYITTHHTRTHCLLCIFFQAQISARDSRSSCRHRLSSALSRKNKKKALSRTPS